VSSTEQANNEMERETYIGGRDDIQMVGREKEKKHILKLLQNCGDQKSSIISIVGLGGMGKTTVAKFVYTLKDTNEFHFDLKAWVYVSMDFKLEKVIADIISQLDGRLPDKDITLHHLKSQLDHILYDKVYLIVLDDLWEERVQTLKELVAMLQSGKNGSKIVVTTRSEKAATTLSVVGSSHFHMVDPIKLEGLSDDECWSVMRPQNLGDDQIIDFVDTGKEIAKKMQWSTSCC
jgi:aquaporin TIP